MMKKLYLGIALGFAMLNPLMAEMSINKEELVEYTGTITTTNRRLAELKTVDSTIYLMVGRLNPHVVTINDGDLVTAKGYKMIPSNDQQKDKVGGFIVKVAMIEAGGNNYILPEGRAGRYCRGEQGFGRNEPMNHP